MDTAKPDQPGTLPVTTARARLFDLVEDLLTGRSSRIELRHRSHEEHVVIIRKGELEGMEADLEALRSRVGPEPRPLRGIAALHVDPEQTLAGARAAQAKLAAGKRAGFARP